MTFSTYCVDLGPIKLLSFLDQPLNAEVVVSDADPTFLQNLKATLAPKSAYQAAGLQAPDFPQLNFIIRRTNLGEILVQIRSAKPIKTPILNLMLQFNWSNGSLEKTYTLLLDPPAANDQPAVANNPVIPPAKAATPVATNNLEQILPFDLPTKISEAETVKLPFPKNELPGNSPALATINNLHQQLETATAQVLALQKEKQLLLLQLEDVKKQNQHFQQLLTERQTSLVETQFKLQEMEKIKTKNANLQAVLDQRNAALAAANAKLVKLQNLVIQQNKHQGPRKSLLTYFEEYQKADLNFLLLIILGVSFLFTFVAILWQKRKRVVRFG